MNAAKLFIHLHVKANHMYLKQAICNTEYSLVQRRRSSFLISLIPIYLCLDSKSNLFPIFIPSFCLFFRAFFVIVLTIPALGLAWPISWIPKTRIFFWPSAYEELKALSIFLFSWKGFVFLLASCFSVIYFAFRIDLFPGVLPRCLTYPISNHFLHIYSKGTYVAIIMAP